MDIKPEYEIFGRDVAFEDITPIKHIHQPGILSPSRFLNPSSLWAALEDLCFLQLKEEVLVYFKNIRGSIGPRYRNEKRDWWSALRELAHHLGKDFPAGLSMEYWYSPDKEDEKAFKSSEFKKERPPYQALMKLFDNAIQGFSCFVNGSQAGIELASTRTNYENIQSGEGLIHDEKTLWRGTPSTLLASARTLHDACEEMEREYVINVSGYNYERAEVRIITRRGALVGSLVDGDSAAFVIDNSSLDDIVRRHNKRRADLLASLHT